jgi:hypothetical protein
VKGLEATLNKFILSLEFYDEAGRKKIATGAQIDTFTRHPSCFIQSFLHQHSSAQYLACKCWEGFWATLHQ